MRRTVCSIVTAPDACPCTRWFNQLDVVVVPIGDLADCRDSVNDI